MGSFIFSSILSCSKVEKEPVKIGYVATLSGRLSDSGIKARNGIELAVAKINKAGGISGRKIKLIVKDNQNDPGANGKVITQLIDEGVIAIVGPLKSSMAQSSLEAIKNQNVLMISPTISTDSIKNLDDNFLRIIPVASNQAKGIAEKMVKDGCRTVSVIYDASNFVYAHPLYLSFENYFQGRDNHINFVFGMTEKNPAAFDRIAKKLAQAKSEALFLITSGIDAAFLCQQIKKTELNLKIYGSYWVKSGNIIEEGGKSVEGLTIITPYSRPEPTQAYTSFKETYIKEYGIEPHYLSIYAYDAVQVIFKGMVRCRKTYDAAAIKSTIIDERVFEGLEDDIEINRFGDAVRKDMFVVINDGKFKRIGE